MSNLFFQILIYLLTFASVLLLGILLLPVINRGISKKMGKEVVPPKKVQEEEDSLLPMNRKKFFFLNIIATGGGAILLYILTLNPVWGSLGGLLGFFIPRMIYQQKEKKTLVTFDNQLMDALDAIANSLRAGLSLVRAFEMIARDGRPPLSFQMEMMLREVKFGTSLEKALQNFTNRVKSKDLSLAVTAINIAREVGGNLPEIFTRVAETIRERRKIEEKISAITAQGRMQSYVLSGVPVFLVVVIYLIDAEMIRPLFTTPTGWVIVGFAAFIELIAWRILGRIMIIDF